MTCAGPRQQINGSSRPEDMKDAVRSLRARLKTKNVAVQMLALTLLETLVKNCGPELHLQVATRDIMGELQQLAVPGNADRRVTHKVQQLLQAWSEAFTEMRREMPLFYDTYQDLLDSGVQFPPLDPSIGPAFASASGRSSDVREPPGTSRSPAARPGGASAPVVESRGGLSGAAMFDVEMLKGDLDKVNVEVSLMIDMLTAAAADASKDEPAPKETQKLIEELVRNCSAYQQRVVKLIEEIPESVQEDVIPLLLQANEEILRALELHAETSPHIGQKAPPLPPPPAKGSLRLKSGMKGAGDSRAAKSNSDPVGERAAATEHIQTSPSGEEEDFDLQVLLGAPPVADTSRIAAAPACGAAPSAPAPAPLPPPPAPLAPPPARSAQGHAASPTQQNDVAAGVEEGWGVEEDDLAELLGSLTAGVKVSAKGSASALQLRADVQTLGCSHNVGLTEMAESVSVHPETSPSPGEDDFAALVPKDNELQALPCAADSAGSTVESEKARDEPAPLNDSATDASSSADLLGSRSDGVRGEAIPILDAPPKAGAAMSSAEVTAKDGVQECGEEGRALAAAGASSDDLIKF